MKILLLGKNGQVGWELQRALAPLGELTAFSRNGENGWCGDVANLDGLRDTVRCLKPDVVVNAAAYTAVDKAEEERSQADLINAQAPEMLAQEMKKLGGWVVHYSTDYVFDGKGDRPWLESDHVAPINYYGRSKLIGEQAIQSSGCKHLIFRTSWVYSARGNNFAKTMLRLAKERDQLKVINDQIGAPTGAELLADVTAHAIRDVWADPDKSGLYHLVAGGETSWYEYACFIFGRARQQGQALRVQDVEPTVTSAYPTPALRPHNSRLNTQKLQGSFALRLPDWQDGVARMLHEIIGKQA
ncbi:dTDP-4-dehydrorhamnose reductase [Allopusillimonas ginsengisoli]|uniref:dTDP-4-dehydrorhamnose reductase n=1 Tax=Allopusillimonas ginsengisoli TaxID=453575 RepID=UPI0039C3B3E4